MFTEQHKMMAFSPAKINLCLAITGLNATNYHNLVGITLPLDFGDEISITKSDCNADICTVSTDIGITNQEQNLAFKALKLFKEKTGCEDFFNINITKKIPVMAGFGGGSSNAAAVLKLLNKETKFTLSDDSVYEICAKIGSDCHFFVKNQCAIVRGLGESIEPLDEKFSTNIKKYNFVIFKPKHATNTTLAYKNLRENFRNLYRPTGIAEKEVKALITAVENCDEFLPIFNTFADMAQKTDKTYLTLQKDLLKTGSQMMLTGSGSGCFCVFKDKNCVDEIEEIVKFYLWKDVFFKETAAS